MEEHIFVGTLNMAYSNRRYFNVRELWGSKVYLRVNNKSLICKKNTRILLFSSSKNAVSFGTLTF